MAFTDGDLVFLKSEIEQMRPRRVAIRILELLSRLQAAELCADYGILLSAYLIAKKPDALERGALEVWDRRYEAWNRECGK